MWCKTFWNSLKGERESKRVSEWERVNEREREPDINSVIIKFRNRENGRNENCTKNPRKTIPQGWGLELKGPITIWPNGKTYEKEMNLNPYKLHGKVNLGWMLGLNMSRKAELLGRTLKGMNSCLGDRQILLRIQNSNHKRSYHQIRLLKLRTDFQ